MEEYLSHNEIIKQLTKEECEELIRRGISMRPNDILQKVVCRIKPEIKVIVEIGTWQGMSALAMGSCSNVEHVYTFDVNPVLNPYFYWKKFKILDKMTYICRTSSEKIYEDISKIKFDLAYIDGSHETDAATKDWDSLRQYCNRILMDDTDDDRLFGIIKPYGAQRISFRFAYWEKDGNYDIVNEIKKDLIWDEPYGKMDFRHLDKKE